MATPPSKVTGLHLLTPRRRAATEYELYTVGQQSTPDQWLHVGWPIRFGEGRDANRAVLAGWLDAWTAESIRAAGALAPLFGAGAGDASETIGSLEMVPVLSEPAPVWAGETGLVTDAFVPTG